MKLNNPIKDQLYHDCAYTLSEQISRKFLLNLSLPVHSKLYTILKFRLENQVKHQLSIRIYNQLRREFIILRRQHK
jgi:hypothetical protein